MSAETNKPPWWVLIGKRAPSKRLQPSSRLTLVTQSLNSKTREPPRVRVDGAVLLLYTDVKETY